MDDHELALFRASVRAACDRATGEALDAALDELGWRDALADDRRAAVATLFELQGSTGATSSALDELMASRLGASGDVAVVLPALERWGPPAHVAGEELTISGLGTGALRRRSRAVAVATTGDADTLVTVETRDLALRAVCGLDPDLGLVEVAGDRVTITAVSHSPPSAWADAIVDGQLALAHELIGAARAMLQLARDHAVERVQFGRPIAAFQAVRHRLADGLVAVEAGEAALGAAWDDPSPLSAALAKAIAGRSARAVARHVQQVLAGIGFTTDHPFHRYLRRVLVLDRMLGDPRSLTQALGEELLRTRRLPAVLAL